MGALIALPEGVEHGTPEGHEAGCKGDRARCPAQAAFGMSCTTAYVRSTTTPDRYFKAKARDPRPAAIARTLGFVPDQRADEDLEEPAAPPAPTVAQASRAPKPKPKVVSKDAATQARIIEKIERQKIRQWAASQGLDVAPVGRIPESVITAYKLRDVQQPAPRPMPIVPAEATPAPMPVALAQATVEINSPVDPAVSQRSSSLHESCFAHHDELTARLQQAITERDSARSLAARVWDDLTAAESALTFVLQTWGTAIVKLDQRDAQMAGLRGIIDRSTDGVGTWDDVPWTGREVLQLLDDLRAALDGSNR